MPTNNSVDKILTAFSEYCKTGYIAVLQHEDFNYLQHAVSKAQHREGTLGGHPIFMLMALTGDPAKVVPFLEASANIYHRSVQ
jgi:hypothetical protein